MIRQRNVIVDRRDFDSRNQQSGESVDEFFRSRQEIAAFRDLCTACVDERLRDRLVEEARRRLLETANLTLPTASDICRAAENAANSRSAIGGQIEDVEGQIDHAEDVGLQKTA